MSRSPKHYKDALVLSSTTPYVDALLTVSISDSTEVSASEDPNAFAALITQFKVHRIVLSRLSTFFMTEFKRLEAENSDIESEVIDNNQEQALWSLDIDFSGSKERPYFNLFPKFLDFLYGKPLSSQEVRGARCLFCSARFKILTQNIALLSLATPSHMPLNT